MNILLWEVWGEGMMGGRTEREGLFDEERKHCFYPLEGLLWQAQKAAFIG